MAIMLQWLCVPVLQPQQDGVSMFARTGEVNYTKVYCCFPRLFT